MKRWLILVICLLVLSGCSRYTPIEMSTAAMEEETDGEMGEQAEDMSVEPANAQEQPTVTTEPEEKMVQITDEGGDIPDREPVKVKGIYISAYVAGSEEMMNNIIANIDATELNAVVIDFKDDEGRITTPLDVPAFNEIGACKGYVKDMRALIQKLKEHNIYAIARVVTFRDPYLAEQKPEWSLKKGDGSVYRDKKGMAWINPYKQEVWDYLLEVGRQARAVGFDEIQFDYIRFSTEASMQEVVFDDNDTLGRSKTDIITEFTEYAYKNLAPTGLFVSADVFGAIIGSEQDADAVGQIYGRMAANLDYICPMIYPSHYGEGNFGLDYPDKHPYETILAALHASKEDLEPHKTEGVEQAIVRPWLQDFTASYLKNYIKYGDEQIRDQIRAVKDAGYDEWILWNASNKYHFGGVEKEVE